MLKTTIILLCILFVTSLFAQDEFLWYHQYGSEEGREYGRSIIAEEDGTFTVIGKTEITENGDGDILLMRFAANGDSLFSAQYDMGADDYPRDFMKVDDYYIGYGGSNDNEQGMACYWISVINEDLEMEDVFLFETETSYVSETIRTSNGNFLMVGDDCLLVSVDGEVLAQPNIDYGLLSSVIEMENGNYAVVAYDLGYVFAMNDDLEIQDTLARWDRAYDLIKGDDNSIYSVRSSWCDCDAIIISKYDMNWEIQWMVDQVFHGFFRLYESDDMLFAIDPGDLRIVGINKDNGTELVRFTLPLDAAWLNDYIFIENDIICIGEVDEDIWIGAVDRNPAKVPDAQEGILPDQMEISVFPNPFNSTTSINYSINNQSEICLQIYNTRGQLVDVLLNQVMPVGQHSVKWNAGSANSGVYLVRLNTENEVYLRKTLLVK